MIFNSSDGHRAILGGCAYFRKAHMPSDANDTFCMKQKPLEIVASNLRTLMAASGMTRKDGTPNQSRLAKRSGVNQRTIGRILALEMTPTIDLLEEIALAFGLHSWQLLIPGLDPSNPPTFVMSEAERQFYRKLDELRVAEPPPHKYVTN